MPCLDAGQTVPASHANDRREGGEKKGTGGWAGSSPGDSGGRFGQDRTGEAKLAPHASGRADAGAVTSALEALGLTRLGRLAERR